MKQRVYSDTSVFGGYFDEEFEDSSIRIITEFKKGKKLLVLSDITLRELDLAPESVRKSVPPAQPVACLALIRTILLAP